MSYPTVRRAELRKAYQEARSAKPATEKDSVRTTIGLVFVIALIAVLTVLTVQYGGPLLEAWVYRQFHAG